MAEDDRASLRRTVRLVALSLSLTGLGALAVNLTCAFMLARYRAHAGSLTRAAFSTAQSGSTG
jgi:hypothetical protein